MQKSCAQSKRLKDWVSECRESGPSRMKGLEAFREAMWKRTGLVPRFVVQQRLERFYPRLDAYESNREYFITAELPGVDLQDIELLVSSNNLTLRGDRRKTVPEEGRRLFREQLEGTFTRSLDLEEEVDPKGAKAKLSQGILHITLPKLHVTVEETEEVKIQVEESEG